MTFKTAFEEEVEHQEAENRLNTICGVLLVIMVVVFVLYFSSCDRAYAEDVDMSKIAMIESSGCKYKVGDGGKSIGCYQISQGVLKEYNRFNQQNYKVADLYGNSVNLKIATWYMNKRIPQMLKHYGIKDTVRNRLIAYNAGIKAVKEGRLPKVTKAYLKKYGV